MKALQDRIVTYITASNGLVSLDKLITVAAAVGFSEAEVLQALSGIGKRLKSTVRGDMVYYQIPPAPKTPIDHLAWVRNNYPRMTEETDGSGIDIDYSFMFLKTKEERDLFKSQMSGRPMMYNKKRYGNQR